MYNWFFQFIDFICPIFLISLLHCNFWCLWNYFLEINRTKYLATLRWKIWQPCWSLNFKNITNCFLGPKYGALANLVSDIVFTEINLKNSISGNPVILNLATLLVVEFQKYHQLISWSKIWAIANFNLSSDIVFMEINWKN